VRDPKPKLGMPTVSTPSIAFSDDRGTIIDLVEGELFEAASVITSRKGAIRGNHYHLKTTQVVYIVSGQLRVVTQMPDGVVASHIAKAGDLVRTPPVERHAFEALSDTTFVVLTHGPRSGSHYEDDTFRLARPLIG